MRLFKKITVPRSTLESVGSSSRKFLSRNDRFYEVNLWVFSKQTALLSHDHKWGSWYNYDIAVRSWQHANHRSSCVGYLRGAQRGDQGLVNFFTLQMGFRPRPSTNPDIFLIHTRIQRILHWIPAIQSGKKNFNESDYVWTGESGYSRIQWRHNNNNRACLPPSLSKMF